MAFSFDVEILIDVNALACLVYFASAGPEIGCHITVGMFSILMLFSSMILHLLQIWRVHGSCLHFGVYISSLVWCELFILILSALFSMMTEELSGCALGPVPLVYLALWRLAHHIGHRSPLAGTETFQRVSTVAIWPIVCQFLVINAGFVWFCSVSGHRKSSGAVISDRPIFPELEVGANESVRSQQHSRGPLSKLDSCLFHSSIAHWFFHVSFPERLTKIPAMYCRFQHTINRL